MAWPFREYRDLQSTDTIFFTFIAHNIAT